MAAVKIFGLRKISGARSGIGRVGRKGQESEWKLAACGSVGHLYNMPETWNREGSR